MMEQVQLDDMNMFFSTTTDAISRYGEINQRAWEKLGQVQLDMMAQGLECWSKHWQVLGGAKTPADFFAAESDVVADYSRKFSDDARQAIEILSERQRETMACFDPRHVFDTKTSTKSREEKKRAA